MMLNIYLLKELNSVLPNSPFPILYIGNVFYVVSTSSNLSKYYKSAISVGFPIKSFFLFPFNPYFFPTSVKFSILCDPFEIILAQFASTLHL